MTLLLLNLFSLFDWKTDGILGYVDIGFGLFKVSQDTIRTELTWEFSICGFVLKAFGRAF